MSINHFFKFFLFFLFTWHAQAQFRICADPDNLPFSQASTQSGFDIELAQLIARELNQELEVKWVPQRHPELFRSEIDSKVCDAIMSVPTKSEKLLTTTSYAKASFVYVSRSPLLLMTLKNSIVGLPDYTYQNFSIVKVLSEEVSPKRIRFYSVYGITRALNEVAQHKTDLAIIWGPAANWKNVHEKRNLVLTEVTDGPLPQYGLAVGLDKKDRDLKEKIDLILDKNQTEIQELVRKWHLSQAQSD